MTPTIPNTTQTTLIKNVAYGTADGMPLLLDILRPEPMPAQPMPVVVEIHGGGWREGEKDAQRNIALAQHGFFTVTINYRLSLEAVFPAQIEDAKTAIRWLRANAQTYNIDPDRIGVWGHSAGGHLSALLGTSGDRHEVDRHDQGVSTHVQAVVAVSPPVNMVKYGWEHFDDRDKVFEHLFGGPAHEHLHLVRMADPLTYLRSDAPPFLIIHGDHDETVPVEHGDALYHALQAAGIDIVYVRIEGGDHGLDGHWPQIGQQTLAFFRKHLMKQAKGADDGSRNNH
jgi:acetyl esterase/lipase